MYGQDISNDEGSPNVHRTTVIPFAQAQAALQAAQAELHWLIDLEQDRRAEWRAGGVELGRAKETGEVDRLQTLRAREQALMDILNTLARQHQAAIAHVQ